MIGPFLRKYGVSDTIQVERWLADGSGFDSSTTFAAGDVKVCIDGVTIGNIDALPVFVDDVLVITLTGAKLTGKKISVVFKDQTSPQDWHDMVIGIETYGHSSAQHPFELDGTLAATIASIKGSGTPDVAAVITAIAALNDLSDADVRADVLAAVIHGTTSLQVLMQSIGDGLVTPPVGW